MFHKNLDKICYRSKFNFVSKRNDRLYMVNAIWTSKCWKKTRKNLRKYFQIEFPIVLVSAALIKISNSLNEVDVCFEDLSDLRALYCRRYSIALAIVSTGLSYVYNNRMKYRYNFFFLLFVLYHLRIMHFNDVKTVAILVWQHAEHSYDYTLQYSSFLFQNTSRESKISIFFERKEIIKWKKNKDREHIHIFFFKYKKNKNNNLAQ